MDVRASMARDVQCKLVSNLHVILHNRHQQLGSHRIMLSVGAEKALPTPGARGLHDAPCSPGWSAGQSWSGRWRVGCACIAPSLLCLYHKIRFGCFDLGIWVVLIWYFFHSFFPGTQLGHYTCSHHNLLWSVGPGRCLIVYWFLFSAAMSQTVFFPFPVFFVDATSLVQQQLLRFFHVLHTLPSSHTL
jgi:hypothetical protein